MRALVHPFGQGHLVPARILGLLQELLDGGGASHITEVVEKDGNGLEPVAVTVDDGVIKPPANRRRLRIRGIGHDVPP